MALAEKVRELRETRGWTLDQLADEAGISKAYLWQIESGKTKRPSGQILSRLGSALRVTVTQLLEDKISYRPGLLSELPPGLKEFVERRRKHGVPLPPEDIEMLADLKYRGRAPETPEDWQFIYEAIGRTLG